MRVAIIVEGTRGDVHPMLVVGAGLERDGHRVRLFGPPDFSRDAAERGLDFIGIGPSVRDYLTETAGALHGNGIGLAREMRRWSARATASQMRVLPRAVADADFVLGAGSTLLAGSMAELHGIPFRYVAYTPGLLPSREHSPVLFPFQLRAPWANRLLWRVAAACLNALALRGVNRHRAALGLVPLADLSAHVLSDYPLVAADRPLAPVPQDCGGAYDQIRCLHAFEATALPDDIERFLDAGPPPIYLGFGSMTDPDPGATTRRLLDAIGRLGCRAIVSRGWAGLGDAPLPPGILAIGAVSHAALFPRLAAVVHHGGAGTTHTAARAGVPQVVVPHVLDQFYFARRAAALGIAPPPLRRVRLDVRRLVATLEDVLASRTLTARARDLARRLVALGPTTPDAARVLATQPRAAASLAA